MTLAPFFSRAYTAVGAHLGITREELETILTDRIVGLKLGESCASEGNDKWISELLINLLSRLYPSIAISGNDPARKRISDIALAINPKIKITHNLADANVVVRIGESSSDANSFTACASGWAVKIGKQYIDGPSNPYSAGAAAALATWKIFQTIFDIQNSQKLADSEISLSLLDFSIENGKSETLPPVDLGEVAVAGLGAVGNPAIWAWAKHGGLKGKLHLIDPEKIELSNLQRYILPTFNDKTKSKVQVAKRELKNTKLYYKHWSCTLEEFAQKYKGISKLPTICVSLDNIDGRRTAQALLPRLVVNGWTSDSGLGTSWHNFLGDNACLGCLYHPKGTSLSQLELASKALGLEHDQLALLWVAEKPLKDKEIKTIENHLGLKDGQLSNWDGKRVQDVYSDVICGQVGIDLKGINHIATVPMAHQSVLAGILMAAELVKRSSPDLEAQSQPNPLVIWDDIMRPPPKYWTVNRLKETGCFCGDEDYQGVFKKKWGKK